MDYNRAGHLQIKRSLKDEGSILVTFQGKGKVTYVLYGNCALEDLGDVMI